MQGGEPVKKRMLLILPVLLFLLLPPSALASGRWRTLTEALSEDELWLPVSEYTGESG